MGEASRRDESEWFGFARSRDRVESSDVDITTAPVKAWSSDHRRRLLQTPAAKGLVPIMGVERVDDQFRAFELPAPGASLASMGAEGKRTKWREQAAIVESASRAAHEGHLLGLDHGALSEESVHVADREVAVSGMGLTRGASLPDDAEIVAPEVRAGATPTVRSDVYSLGRVLDRGLEADRGAAPLALRQLVASATSEDPSQRPASALALADGIRTAGGASMPTYALAALGGSTAGRSLGNALAKRGGTPAAGESSKAAAAAGVLGAGGVAAARTVGSVGGKSIGTSTSAAADGAAANSAGTAGTLGDRPKRSKRGAVAAGAALVGIAGLGLWAASDADDGATSVANGVLLTTTIEVDGGSADATTAGPATPTTDAPTTDAPTTSAPATTAAPPTTAAPTTAPPTTAAPTTAAPTTTAAPSTTAPSTTAVASETTLAPATALQAATAASSYEILHAIPGVTADAYLDGELAASGFGPGMVAGPLGAAQGLQTLTLFPAIDSPPAAAADRTDEPLLETSLADVEPGTLVAYLDGTTARVAAFANDLGNTPAGQGRVAIRQFASDGRTVLVDGEVVRVPAAPADGTTLDLPAGPHSFSVTDASGAVLFDETIDVADGQLSSLFVRPGDDGTGAALSVRTVVGLSSAPTGIPSGTGGLLGDDGPDGLAPALLMMIALGGGGFVVQQRRERRVR